MDINSRVAIVTGAASGLGRATAEMLAQSGARLALVDLHADTLHDTAVSLGGRAFPCDVSDSAGSETAYIEICDSIGAPHILINCAGIAPPVKVVTGDGPGSLADFERVVRINLIGTYNWLRLAADGMRGNEPNADGERGVVVNTASVAAFEGQIGQTAYAASKGGVASLSLPAARELARYGIRVAALAPGIFGTPMVTAMPANVQDNIIATIPFPQRFGKPDEFASMVKAMIGNPMINGCTLRLDAALRMQAR